MSELPGRPLLEIVTAGTDDISPLWMISANRLKHLRGCGAELRRLKAKGAENIPTIDDGVHPIVGEAI